MAGRGVTAPREPELGTDGLTVAEVGVLWSFLHGDIMIGGIRERIRAHWGLCPRHAWGHAIVEIELWETGAGLRGGHQPFDVVVLHEDLLGLARQAASGRLRRWRGLRRRGTCYVCDQLKGPAGPGPTPIGYAGFDSAPLTAEANRMHHIRKWLAETSAMWSARSCPRCSDITSSPGVLCRSHLLEHEVPSSSRDVTIAHLDRLAPHLRKLLESMSDKGDPSTPDDDASWIEVLGWFHGWSFPLALQEA